MSRKYQVVVFGATGFSGRLASEYFTTHYLGKLRIALAGRSRQKLEALRDELKAINPAAVDIGILIGDSGSKEDMEALVEQTDVVASTAGPFALYGSVLLEACAQKGTSYCDLSGEAGWNTSMEAKHHGTAEASGARIVPSSGWDSVPSDLGTYLVVKRFSERFGRPPARVDMYCTRIKGFGLQGGTANTLLNMVQNPAQAFPQAPKHGKGKTKLEWTKGLWYDSKTRLWTIPFFMASANQSLVRRSNAQLGYAENMTYRESSGFSSFMPAFMQVVGMAVLMSCMFFPPTRWLMKRFVLPQSGQGPSRETMLSGSYRYTFVATGDEEKQITMDWASKGDVGGIGTTILFGECAVCLALEKERLPSKGGVLTPTSAMAEALWERLRVVSWKLGGSPDISVTFR